MYKAIIVDDERKICQLILELGDWKRFDIEVSAVCTDGAEALEAIRRVQPDIVLTDIRMPVYDGLELIRKATEEGYKCAFIIISGYKYFEYAYSAFKYGVVDYLLKPIDQKQVNEVLEKTCSMLNRQSAYRKAEDEIRRLNEHMELTRRKQLFHDLLEETERFPGTPEGILERYGKRLPRSCFQAFFLETNRNLEADPSELLVQKLMDSVRRVFQTAEGSAGFGLCMETVHGGLACILNYEAEEADSVKGRLTALLHDAREVTGMFGNTWVVIGTGSRVMNLKELPETVKQAETAAAARVVLGGDRVLDLAEHRFSLVGMGQILGEGSLKTLKNALEGLSADMYRKVLVELEKRTPVQPPVRIDVIWQLRDTVLLSFDEYAGKQEEEIGWEERRQEWLRALSQCVSVQEFYQEMKRCGGDCLLEWRQSRQNREKLPIRLAKAWIEEHYGEAVTLEAVAEQVDLSPAYFSTTFKQMEGRTFSEYLTAVRMEAAREFLSTTHMTNLEISSRVGYSDEKYFGKVFKKEVGIRPSEYRKLYQRK